MKILISTDTYFPQVNGASYFTQRLAYNLQKHGHEVRVIAPSQTLKDTDTVINTVRVFGVHSYPVLFYPKFRFCVLFFKNKFVRKIIADFQPDIVHIQGHFSISRMVVKIADETRIPIIATNHFMPENIIHYLPFHSLVGAPIKKWAWKDFSKVFKSAGVITSPTATAARLIQPYVDKAVIPISCGINLSTFNAGTDGEYLKKKYSIRQIPSLLYVGRVDKEKNIDMVLQAFSKAVKRAEFQLIIAGSGAEKENLMALSEKLGVKDNVVFTGFVPDADLPNLYAIVDCFIMAGTAELQSIVTMEAMASGLPVLAVDAVALPELVKDGQNGFLFEYGDIPALSEKMITIFSDDTLRKTMGQKSLELIMPHDMAANIKRFEELYQGEISRA
jgi:1,2-diacylglycerol 3-alpha-glucosyltransferase